jgi:hypothetical protein
MRVAATWRNIHAQRIIVDGIPTWLQKKRLRDCRRANRPIGCEPGY